MDEQAFEALLHARQQELFAFLLARVRCRETALDLLQDVCLQAWRHQDVLGALSEIEQIRYLFSMARNRLRDEWRKGNRQASQRTVALGAYDPPAAECARDPRLAELDDLIGALPDEERTLLYLQIVAKLDTQAIAERVELNSSTVRSKLSRIRAKLRDQMSKLLKEAR
jgi:RNA polymerase sigma factor (sigma-70 family)